MTLRTVLEAKHADLKHRHPLIISTSTGYNFNETYVGERVYNKTLATAPTAEDKRAELEKTLQLLTNDSSSTGSNSNLMHLSDELSSTSVIYSRLKKNKYSKQPSKNVIVGSGSNKKIITASRGELQVLPNTPATLTDHLSTSTSVRSLEDTISSSRRKIPMGDDDDDDNATAITAITSTTVANKSVDIGLPKVNTLSTRQQQPVIFNPSAPPGSTAAVTAVSRAISPLTGRSPVPSSRATTGGGGGGGMSYTSINKSILLDEYQPNNSAFSSSYGCAYGSNAAATQASVSELQKLYFGRQNKK